MLPGLDTYVLYGSNTSLTELHADLFSHHANPLEVNVFVAVDERGEDVVSDEICRRYNGKQQRRTRGGRGVQLLDCFMILYSSSRHLCTYTYVLRTTKYTRRKQAKKSPEVRSRDGHVEHVCKNSGSYLLKTAWTF